MEDLRVPPHSMEIERSFIGALLSGHTHKIMEEAARFGVSPDWFYMPPTRTIWQAACEIIGSNRPLDVMILVQYLKDTGRLDHVGGALSVERCIDECASWTSATSYLEILHDKFAKRTLLQTIRTKEADLYTARHADDIASDLGLVAAQVRRPIRAKRSFKEIVQGLIAKYHNARHQGFHGLPVFLLPIQLKLGGLPQKETFFLAARPSMGKTTFMLNQADYLATRPDPVPAGIISLEMTEERIRERQIGARARINIARLERGGMTEELERAFMHTAVQIQEAPLYVKDGPRTIEQVCSAMQDLVAEHNVQYIGLDYIQLIRPSAKRNSRNEEVMYWSNTLVGMAKELNVHLMILSQLSRTKTKVPSMNDLRDSGALEQDADNIAFLYPDWEKVDEEDVQETMDLPVVFHIEKARYGPTGKVKILFRKQEERFDTWDSNLKDWIPPEKVLQQQQEEVPF